MYLCQRHIIEESLHCGKLSQVMGSGIGPWMGEIHNLLMSCETFALVQGINVLGFTMRLAVLA